MRQPGAKTKGYREAQLRRVLGPEVCEILDEELGVMPVAAETNIRRARQTPNGEEIGPLERAVVCRLYPKTDRARIAFGLANVECAQCIYLPQPDRPGDDDTKTVLDRGFYEAAYDAGQSNQRVSGIVVP